MTVCIIDTSVFCEILKVPGKTQQHEAVLTELKSKLEAAETLLLPIAVVVETGNHIGHVTDGRMRRDTADRFTKQVGLALAGRTPFRPTPIQEAAKLLEWIREFPDAATRGLGFGDLTITKIWSEQCAMCPHHRVYIWSLDQHLASHDRNGSLLS